MSMLLDTIQIAGGTESASPVNAADFMQDAKYHSNRYLLESALRDVGATPNEEADLPESPYDTELRKLIDAITLE